MLASSHEIAGGVRRLSLYKKKKNKKNCFTQDDDDDDDDDDERTRKPSSSRSKTRIQKGASKPFAFGRLFNGKGSYLPRDFVRGYPVGWDNITDGGPCSVCMKEHSPCGVCYKFHHTRICPYTFELPKGATFNPIYEISCGCGYNVFNEDKWMCTMCNGRRARVKGKICAFCDSNGHASYECPVEKVKAANERSYREVMLSRDPELPFLFSLSEVDAPGLA